jgi:Cytochrome P460
MLGPMRRLVLLALAAAALAAAVSLAQARSSKPAAKPLPGLPQYTAGYKSWTKINRRPIPPRRNDPHDSTKNIYASKAKRGARYPYGTVIVKEGSEPGTRFVKLMAVMRKVRGASPRNNDWIMIEWTRSSARARFSELARGQVCYSCHVGAKRNDYVFTRR